MAMYPDTLADFVNLTLSKYRRRMWVDLSPTLQNYIFPDRLIQGNRTTEKGGQDIRWKVQTSTPGNFKPTEMWAVEQTVTTDMTTEAKQNWCKFTDSWQYDIDEEAFQSDDEVRIVNEIEMREHAMYVEFFEGMEAQLWSAPNSSTQAPRQLSGIPFWLQKYTTATPDFQGGDPSGFTTGAGNIAVATVPQWKNWAGQYIEVSRTDLIQKVRDAMWKTNFKPPKTYAVLETGKGKNSWEHLTTRRVQGKLEQYLDTVNDDLGPDVSKYEGATTVRGVPVTAVAYLENNDTSDPWYGVNWSQFFYFVKGGRDMNLLPLKQLELQPTVYRRHMFHWCNIGVYNRRQSGFVLSL